MRTILVTLSILAISSPTVSGQTIAYQFADATGTPTSSFNVAIGQTVDVRVYLMQLTGTSLSDDGGLLGASVRVNFGSSSFTSLTTTLPAIIANGGPWSDGVTNGSDATSGVITVVKSAAPGVAPISNRILLGTYQFTGQSIGVTNLSAVDTNPGVSGDIVTFNNFFELDDQLVGPVNSFITVVPEPSTILLIGTAGIGICRVIVRRRKASASPALAA